MDDLTDNNQETSFCDNGLEEASSRRSEVSRRSLFRCLPRNGFEIPLFSFTMLVMLVAFLLMFYTIIKASTLSYWCIYIIF